MPIKPYSNHDYAKALESAKQNSEKFRHEANQAYAQYIPRYRRMLRAIKSKNEFYARYQESFRPVLVRLTQKKAQTTMKSYVMKHFSIASPEAEDIVSSLYAQQHEKHIQETIAFQPRRAKKSARRILELPIDQADTLLDRYKQVCLYRDVAKESHIVIYDPFDSILNRPITRYRIRRDQRKTSKMVRKRLNHIEKQLLSFDTQDGDLLRRIVHHSLTPIELIALRTAYENKLHLGKATTVRAELDRFEKVTKTYIDQKLDIYTSQNTEVSLREITRERRDIEQVIQDLFLLDNSARNRLVINFSDYSRLYNEKNNIIASQQARDDYSSRVF